MRRIGKGVYSFSEAARLTKTKPSTLRTWFRRDDKRPALRGDYEPVEGRLALSFLDLIDANAVVSLRQLGLSMQQVRLLYAELERMLQTRHPFANRALWHDDGNKIWLKATSLTGDEHCIEVLKRQHGFPEIVRPFLKKVRFAGDTGLVSQWDIEKGVVINPSFAFGKPCTEVSRRPTRVLAAAFHANEGDAHVVAHAYGVTPDEVHDAVTFERGLAA